MSYPEPRYLGDTGEVSATYRPHDTGPDLTYPNGVRVDYLTTGATNDGSFGLYRWTFGPDEGGPDAHFHRTMAESFFILDGAVRLYDGRKWVETGPGDFLYVPPGGLHGFKNVPGTPASMLILFTPGAPREEYFETLAEIARGRQMADAERAAFLERHDNHYV